MLSASVEPQFPSSTSASFHHLKRRRSASPPVDDDNGFPGSKRPDIPRWASVIQAPSSEPPVMEVVRKAEQILINSGSVDVESDIADFNNLYLPPIFRMKHLPLRPLLDFSKLSAKLIFGAESPAVLENRVATVPCLSASSLSVGAEFLARHYPKRTIYIPLQTWGIHKKIFRLAGLCVKTYRYYDQKMHGLHLKALLEDLGSATGGEVVLLHACGQGVDPTLDQWKKIRKLMREKGLLPFFDSTYQGLASGNLDSDAMAVRMFVAAGGECFVAQSYVENMGLYGERVDAFSISSELLFLVEYAGEAAESETPLVEFLATVKESLAIVKESFNKKIVFVEIPISEGMDVLCSVKIKLTARISYLKCITQCTMLWASEWRGLRAGLVSLGSFDLLFNGSVLDPKTTLAECGIEEHNKVSLSWKSKAIHISLPLRVNSCVSRKIVDIDGYDTVKKMKARVHQLTGIPPEKQLLRYENRWLVGDSKSLVESGISVCPHEIFPWCPRISALEVFPSGAWRAKLCRWDSTLHIGPSTEGGFIG